MVSNHVIFCPPFDIHITPYIQVNNIFSTVDDNILLKHHSKQTKQFSEMMGENLRSGFCLIQIGKDIITFSLERSVADHLKLVHNERLNWKIIGRELVISKKKENEE